MGKLMKISICIPTYEAGGAGVDLVFTAIESIKRQTYSDVEVIISDHSQNDAIESYANGITDLDVKYLRNSKNIGSPAHNSNYAISKASGDFVKILNMDDYFDDDDALHHYMDALFQGAKWVLSSTKIVNLQSKQVERSHTARIVEDGKNLLTGVNTIGCPSVGVFPRDNYFDTNVKYAIDCELWYSLLKKYGNPSIIDHKPMCVGMGPHSLTEKLSVDYPSLIKQDAQYCLSKHLL